MKIGTEHEYTTYPRRFDGYRWYKPLLVGILFVLFTFILNVFGIELITKAVFGTAVQSTGYDDMDFYSTAGAFKESASAASIIPCLLLAALIVGDRPISSYFSSMGGWRWRVFLKTFAVGLVIVGIPTAISCLLKGRTGVIRFTLGGFIFLTLLAPFQGVAEELTYRSYLMQTVSSWFKLPVVGLIVQVIAFSAVHPYNILGIINIAFAAIMYALVCVYTRGLEAGSALHIIGNMTEIYLAGFGIGAITSEQTVLEMAFGIFIKILFFLFVLYADKKLHWFDEVKCDDVAKFNEKKKKRISDRG